MTTSPPRPLVRYLAGQIARLTPPKPIEDIAREAGLKRLTLEAILAGEAPLPLEHVFHLARAIGDHEGRLFRICLRDWNVEAIAPAEDLNLTGEECELVLRIREKLAGRVPVFDDELLAWIDSMPARS